MSKKNEKLDHTTDNDIDTSSPIEKEVTVSDSDEGFPTFTVEVNGEEITLEDRYPQGKIPGVLVMMTPKTPEADLAVYTQRAIQDVIGSDQMWTLIDAGADVISMYSVLVSWRDSRGIGNLA